MSHASIVRSYLGRLTLLAFLLLTTPVSGQTTIHVPSEKATIQSAIDTVNTGGTVLVSAGTYYERIDFKGKNILVMGESGASKTILDGQNLGSVVSFHTGEANSAVFSGFTVQNGKSGEGAGIWIAGAAPTIQNNIVANNGCGEGGGIGVEFASPIIRNNVIHHNNRASDCFPGGVGGGGISIRGAGTAQVLHNLIYENKGGYEGGGISMWAAGAALVEDNIVRNNISTSSAGGGIAIFNEGNSIVRGNVIVNNHGGGVDWAGMPAEFTNNTVAGNSGDSGTAEISSLGWPNRTFRNNLVVSTSGNTAIQCGTSNAITANFTYNDVFSVRGSSYSCLDPTGNNHNVSIDPQFADPPSGNFHLSTGSPVIDVADGTASLPVTDADGNPRVLSGSGGSPLPDLGGYEYQGKTSMSVSLTSLAFTSQKVNTASLAQAVTITNTGTSTLHLKPIQIGPDFIETNDCETPDGLTAGQTCTINVSFQPKSAGPLIEAMTVAGANVNLPFTISLTGSGIAPVVRLSANSLVFGDQPLFTTSAAQIVTLSNIGDAPLVVSNVTSLSAEFPSTIACAIVDPGASCSIGVTFSPTATRMRTSAVVVSDDAMGSPRQIIVSGNGTGPEVSFSPASLNFPPQSVGTLSNPLTLTLTNTGTATLIVSQVILSGDFSITANDCATLAPGATCHVVVTFFPTLFGGRFGSLLFSDNAAASPQQISLSGQGTAPLIQVQSFAPFGSAIVGATTSTQNWNVSNTGNEPLVISSIAMTGDFAETDTCSGLSVAPHTFCLIKVTFTPTSAGTRTGTLSIFHNALSSPTVINLSATALAGYPIPTLTNLSPQSLPIGSNATLTIVGTNFWPATVVYFDNQPLPITSVSPTFITATVSSDLLMNYGEHTIFVANPAPGGGRSADILVPSYRSVQISARSLVFDRYRRVFYASVAAGASNNAKSVVSIDPKTGAIATLQSFSAEPTRLALSSDGQFLFVGVDNLNVIKRINLYSNQIDLDIPLGSSQFSTGFAAADIFPLPNAAHSIAVTLAAYNISPAYQSVKIFDDAVPRPNAYNNGFPWSIQMASDPTLLYVGSGGVSPSTLTVLKFDNFGLSLKTSKFDSGTSNLFSDGKSLFSNSQILDPITLNSIGHFTFSNPQPFSITSVFPEQGSNRVYLLGSISTGAGIWASNSSTFASSGSVLVPLSSTSFANPADVLRWAADGLAFRWYGGSVNTGGASDTDAVIFLRSSLARPNQPGASTPTIISTEPASVKRGIGNLILTINGSGFVPGAVVLWNGEERTTTFVGSSQLKVYIPASDLQNSRDASISVANPGLAASPALTFTIRNYVVGDLDGDGKADLGVWRPSSGNWSVINSGDSGTQSQQWGLIGDLVSPGDYDGDGKADLAVWRPSNGTFYVIRSSDRIIVSQQWGLSGDIPVAGDYDGDGKADYAVWRPSNGTFYVIRSSDRVIVSQQWGLSGDIPVAGDYDGDGKADYAVWRPSNGTFYVIRSSDRVIVSQQWGLSGDIPVPGDYDGDRKTDYAVWRPSNGSWYVVPSGTPSNTIAQQWGGTINGSEDIPVPGDYDGDGKTDFAVWRPSNGTFYIIRSSDRLIQQQGLGTTGDLPVSIPMGQQH